MRQENSKIQTDFIDGAGDKPVNKDYFAYIENDDYACWVMADSLDTSDKKISAKLVAESFIKDFMDKPSLKKRHIKKYLRQASNRLIEESRMVRLKASIQVVVSDYKYFRWAGVGNTRLYHFRKGRLKNKSKDHTLAQMLVDVGDIEPKKLNQHPERNNVNNYLGKKKRIKPRISNKYKFKVDDTLILVTRGFWEKILDDDIRPVISETEENQEVVEELETIILEQEEELDNYSIASIFVRQPYQEDPNNKKFPVKKVIMVLIVIFVMGGSIFGYRYYKRAQRIGAELTEAEQLVEQADEMVYTGNREEKESALQDYREANSLYNKNKRQSRVDEVEEKIDTLKEQMDIISEGENLEEEADENYSSGEYRQAFAGYEEVLEIYNKADSVYRTGEVDRVEEKIELAEEVVQAVETEEEAELFFNSDELSVAEEKYNQVLGTYEKHELIEEQKRIQKRLEEIEIGYEKEKAEKKIDRGESLLRTGDFEDAMREYEDARSIYQDIDDTAMVKELENEIDYVRHNMGRREAENYRTNGDDKFAAGDYEKAMREYELAKSLFQELGDTEAVNDITENIEEVEWNVRYEEGKDFEAKGEEKFNSGDFENAVENYNQALQIYQEIGSEDGIERVEKNISEVERGKTMGEAESYENRGDEKFEAGEINEAIKDYEQASAIYREIGASEKEKEITETIEEIQKDINYNRAEEFENQAEDKIAEDEFEAAIADLEQALEIYQELNKTGEERMIEDRIKEIETNQKVNEAENYKQEADELLSSGSYEAAVEMYKKAGEVFGEIEEDERVEDMNEKIEEAKTQKEYNKAVTLEEEGDELFQNEEYNPAVEKYEEAIEIYRKLNRKEEVEDVEEKIKYAKLEDVSPHIFQSED